MEPPKIKNKKKEEWIRKDLQNKIPKADKRILFVPSQKELFF